MPDQNAREKLLDLLDRKAFDPVLDVKPENYSESDQKRLWDAQDKTRSTQKRYHENYESAKEVYEQFENDLSSDAADGVHRELRALRLPTLKDIRDEFESLARELGVMG